MITALKQVDTIPNILFPWEPHWTLSTVISMTVYWKMGKQTMQDSAFFKYRNRKSLGKKFVLGVVRNYIS